MREREKNKEKERGRGRVLEKLRGYLSEEQEENDAEKIDTICITT